MIIKGLFRLLEYEYWTVKKIVLKGILLRVIFIRIECFEARHQ
jgi:hypothetical protein